MHGFAGAVSGSGRPRYLSALSTPNSRTLQHKRLRKPATAQELISTRVLICCRNLNDSNSLNDPTTLNFLNPKP